MPYKECGFKDKAEVCKFREEDCNPEECDFYNLPYDKNAIEERIEIEREDIREIHSMLKSMKKRGDHKKNKEEYRKLKKIESDKATGIVKLEKAQAKIEGRRSIFEDPRLKRLMKKIEKKNAKRQEKRED